MLAQPRCQLVMVDDAGRKKVDGDAEFSESTTRFGDSVVGRDGQMSNLETRHLKPPLKMTSSAYIIAFDTSSLFFPTFCILHSHSKAWETEFVFSCTRLVDSNCL